MIAAGLKPARIYLEGRGAETLDRIKMRPGELLATVGGLRALGSGRREIIARLRRIHSMGAAVVDIETKEQSDKRGAEMLDAALARIHGERTMPDPKTAVTMQAKSVRSRTKGRTPKREAYAVWRDPALTVGEKVARLRGWSPRALYNTFGPTGVPPGRRSTNN